VPLRMLARSAHLERVGRWLARQEQELQVRLARELVAQCRSLNRNRSQRALVRIHSDHDHSDRLLNRWGRPASGQTSIEAAVPSSRRNLAGELELLGP
jgi:hypothetical protein